MTDFFEKVVGGAVAVGLLIAGLLSPAQEPNLGSTYQTPEVRALFETTLASRITSTDTSFTLTSATDFDGNTLASSTYGFIIDEGTASEEMLLADCTATACTNATRGLSASTGTTTVAALKKEHRRGASVKITDAPSLLFAVNVFKGKQNIENALTYATGVTPSVAGHLVDKEYADSLVFSGLSVIDASTAAEGVVEIATQIQAASSTSSDLGTLALPASMATSTYNSATAALRVLMSGNDGFLDQGFIPSTITKNLSYTGTLTFSGSASSNIASSSISTYTATTTDHSATSTWSKPAGLKYVVVEVVGGGGGGGGSDNGAGVGAGGGGGGGYSKEIIPASALTSTVTVVAGKGGAGGGINSGNGTAGGTTSFGSYLQATGGGANSGATGGAGGVGSGGDVNAEGQDGGFRQYLSADDGVGGFGGNSVLGGGGKGAQNDTGNGGNLYGGGGAGGADTNNTDVSGGSGASGVVIVTEFYY